MFEYKMVIISRKDLGLSAGKLAVQAAHAAVACVLKTKKTHPKWHTKWQQEGAKKVVVAVESAHDFHPLEQKAKNLDLPHYLVQDAGLTEVPPGTQTVLGIGPAPSNLIDQITGDLPLV